MNRKRGFYETNVQLILTATVLHSPISPLSHRPCHSSPVVYRAHRWDAGPDGAFATSGPAGDRMVFRDGAPLTNRDGAGCSKRAPAAARTRKRQRRCAIARLFAAAPSRPLGLLPWGVDMPDRYDLDVHMRGEKRYGGPRMYTKFTSAPFRYIPS